MQKLEQVMLLSIDKKPKSTNYSMAKIQGPNKGKTYSNIYKDKRAHT